MHFSRPNLSDDRRTRLKAQYIWPGMRQTRSDRDSAMPVWVADEFRYSQQDSAAESWFEKDAAQQLAVANEAHQAIAGRANFLNT